MQMDINKNKLDEEWVRQPTLFMQACEKETMTRSAYDRAKEGVDQLKAELDRQIRESPDSFGVVPGSRGVTEAQVSNTITSCDQYREAMVEMFKLKEAFGIASAEVKALDQRCRALENLTKLYGLQYFGSEPKSQQSIDTKEEGKEEVRKSSRRKMRRART